MVWGLRPPQMPVSGWVLLSKLTDSPRYGERDCYFQVEICFPTEASEVAEGDSSALLEPECRWELRQRAIEGWSDHPVVGSEQLIIPLLALLVSCGPAILAGITVMMQRSIALVDAGKYVLAVTMCLLFIGIDSLQRKTFDCRWWHDSHHGNTELCQRGLLLYVCGTLLIIVSEFVLLMLFTRLYEQELKELHQTQMSCLTNSAMSAIRQEQFEEAIQFCTKAIAIDGSCVNAYFRRGVAYAKLSHFDAALDDLTTALRLEPGSAALKHELQRIEVILSEADQDVSENPLEDDDSRRYSIEEDPEEEEDEEGPLLKTITVKKSQKKVRFAS